MTTGQALYAQLKDLDFCCQEMTDNGFTWSFKDAKELDDEWSLKKSVAEDHLKQAAFAMGWSKRTKVNKKGDEEAFPAFNPGSTKHLRDIFFHWVGGFRIQPMRWTKEGDPSTDEDALTSIIQYAENPNAKKFALKLLDYRECVKVLGTYVRGMAPEEGKTTAHGIWKAHGTVSGRFSCPGVPLQTVPAWLRRLFCARPDHWLVESDYSQLEIRTLAIQANARMMREIYDRNGDLYLETARVMFQQPNLRRKKDKEDNAPEAIQGEKLRQLTKVVALLSHYMGSDETAWRTMIKSPDVRELYPHLRVKDVKRLQIAYFQVHKEIPLWWQEIIDEANKTGVYRELVSGRKIDFFGPADGSFLANFRNQSLGAYIVNDAFLKIRKELKNDDIFVIQCHDAIDTDTLEPLRIKETHERNMTKILEYKGRSIHLPVETKISKQSGSYAEVK